MSRTLSKNKKGGNQVQLDFLQFDGDLASPGVSDELDQEEIEFQDLFRGN